MMGRRQKLKSGDEWDAIGGWKKYYAYLQKAGVRKAIKQLMNRRERRQNKQQIRREFDE